MSASSPDSRACLLAEVTVSVTVASLASVVATSSAMKLTSVPPTWKPRLWVFAQLLALPWPLLALPFDLPCPPLAPSAVAGTANSAAASAIARMFFAVFNVPPGQHLPAWWQISAKSDPRLSFPGEIAVRSGRGSSASPGGVPHTRLLATRDHPAVERHAVA